jgi:hypothetical protein
MKIRLHTDLVCHSTLNAEFIPFCRLDAQQALDNGRWDVSFALFVGTHDGPDRALKLHLNIPFEAV